MPLTAEHEGRRIIGPKLSHAEWLDVKNLAKQKLLRMTCCPDVEAIPRRS